MTPFSAFTNKTLLITGGTGSFGRTVLSSAISSGVREIRIFSRDEKKQDDMRVKYHDERIRYLLGDVRDERSLDTAVAGVDYVFHAAALKQVPSCEFYPMEAVKTNVIGTENLLVAAVKHQVAKVICLSTDKAVYPINAMGISKALMEKIAVAKARESGATVISCTRYGNVMASRGSVIPLFIDQIKRGVPITVTDPAMTRYMMSLDQAVHLVLFAFDNGRAGDIFVQKAPAASMGQLAEVLLEIFDAKNPIRVIGTRHGEKLHETLLTQEEHTRAEDLGDYFRIFPDHRDQNYSKSINAPVRTIANVADYDSHNTKQLTSAELRSMLLSLEYVRRQLSLSA